MFKFLMNVFLVMSLLLQVKCQSIVTCSCDLTSSACDANCCCDPDCNQNDINAFICSSATYNADSQLCVNELVFVNNLPTTQVVNDNGLFCIIRERDTSNNFYTDPTIITDSAGFDAASQQYPTYSYDLATTTPTYSQVYYVAGDQIDVEYSNGLQSKLSLPIPGIANTCVDTNPASYLNDQTSTCNRRFTLSSTTCASGTALDPLSYYSSFTVANAPITNSSSPVFIDVLICDGATPPGNITWNAATSVCSNVAVSISYRITYDGTNGISSACLSFPQISDISQSGISQTFSIRYVSSGTTLLNETESRSGNPGYVTGKPLRTATGDLSNLTLDTAQLTLISPNSNGDGTCTGATSKQINFGEDARTGCLMSYTRTTLCDSLYTSIDNLLNIPPSNAYVATYGNTLITSNVTNDWLQPQSSVDLLNRYANNNTTDLSSTKGCTDILFGLNYTVYFANTGSLSNPQPQIIGVEYIPITKTITYECFGVDCISGTVQQFVEITSSVTFVDASSTPSTILRERPTVNARLPSDFFFPFTGTAT